MVRDAYKPRPYGFHPKKSMYLSPFAAPDCLPEISPVPIPLNTTLGNDHNEDVHEDTANFKMDYGYAYKSSLQRRRSQAYRAMQYICGHPPDFTCYRCSSWSQSFIPLTPEDAVINLLVVVSLFTAGFLATAMLATIRFMF